MECLDKETSNNHNKHICIQEADMAPWQPSISLVTVASIMVILLSREPTTWLLLGIHNNNNNSNLVTIINSIQDTLNNSNGILMDRDMIRAAGINSSNNTWDGIME